ncbi:MULTISPECIES: cation:proton antiporter [Actinomyces]|uniref:cation:proton antiporter n=1 Tax=Actinomyces TaxID=1654 RepID=UPI00135816E1|nr:MULTISPECIES: sodium:proton antiporter [Actinomyces]
MNLLIIVAGLLAIAGASQISDRLRVAPALLLLTMGIAVGFLPAVPAIVIEPEVILEGLLPALLYATAVAIPAINFRREFTPVAILAVLLVAVSSAVIGGVLTLVLPSLSVAWAVAMGAVLSPTDAVAISIARRLGVTQRVITVLEGEGLLNDATALVVLSSAISAAVAGRTSAGEVLGSFVLAVVVAVAVGWIVGELTLHLRARVTDASVDTVISFAVPFLAAIPAEHMGGSGLVAAVVAGLVTGHRSPRLLPPDHRIAGNETWHTVELVLEGFIFLVMGLQLFGVVEDVRAEGPPIATAVWLAVLAGVLSVAVRAAIVAPMLLWLRRRGARRAERWDGMSEPRQEFEERCQAIARGEIPKDMLVPWDSSRRGVRRRLKGLAKRLAKGRRGTGHAHARAHAAQAIDRIRRVDADMAYYQQAPLGAREGTIIVWAGMRGAVTLAAAQTLPADAPNRPFLLLIAILVAAGSLVVQGLTLPWVVRAVRPTMEGPADEAERRELMGLLISAAKGVIPENDDDHILTDDARRRIVLAAQGASALVAHAAREEAFEGGEDAGWAARRAEQARARALSLDMVRAQRQALLDAGELGLYSAGLIEYALTRLDYEEITLVYREAVHEDPPARVVPAPSGGHTAPSAAP